jgi:hypothetical protein
MQNNYSEASRQSTPKTLAQTCALFLIIAIANAAAQGNPKILLDKKKESSCRIVRDLIYNDSNKVTTLESNFFTGSKDPKALKILPTKTDPKNSKFCGHLESTCCSPEDYRL